MGSSEAPIHFLKVHRDNLVEHNVATYAEATKPLLMECVFTGNKHDASLSSFADDTARKLVVSTTDTAATVLEQATRRIKIVSATSGLQSRCNASQPDVKQLRLFQFYRGSEGQSLGVGISARCPMQTQCLFSIKCWESVRGHNTTYS